MLEKRKWHSSTPGVAERIVDGGILHLIKQWLKAPVIGEDERGVKKTVGGGKANRMGTPQGGVISPLLANCYLHILDRLWQRRHLKGKLQAHLVRYADDFVVMCRQDVEEPLTALTERELTAIPLGDMVEIGRAHV